MKKNVLTASLILSLLAPPIFGGTIKIPKDKPVATVKVPDSWAPEETDEGIAIESPDQVATVFLEVTSNKKADALIEENITWLTDEQKVNVDAGSKKEKEFELEGRSWSRISWDGTSKEYGPAIIGFLFTAINKNKILTVTYWITKKDSEKHLPALEKIFASVKPIGQVQAPVESATEYSFKVINKTENTIKQVLVSDDKKTWGKFDIGKGINAGKTVKLVWDKSTNGESCKQWVKAVYDDGEESEPSKFDFCEADLEIEFEG